MSFPRAFQILGEDPPESDPRSNMAPSDQRASDAASLAAAAREAVRIVAVALAALPTDIEPASCTAGLREATRASTAAHQIIAEVHELLARLAKPS